MRRFVVPVHDAMGNVAGYIPVGGPVTESQFSGLEVIPGGGRRGGPAMLAAPAQSSPRGTAPATWAQVQRGTQQPRLAQQARAHARRMASSRPLAVPDPAAQLRAWRAQQTEIPIHSTPAARTTLPRHLQPFTPENTAWLAQQQQTAQQQAVQQAQVRTFQRRVLIQQQLSEIHRNREELWRMQQRGEISYADASQRHQALQPQVDQLNAEYRALEVPGAQGQQAVGPEGVRPDSARLTAEQRIQQQAYHEGVNRLYAWMRAGFQSGAWVGEQLRQWDQWAAARGLPHYSGGIPVG